ncbi:hypothetical protein MNBD_GAMMA09-1282 [hydrothermal vent metagenome]|uniref:Rubrerythrin diiron-binding domain-containing protein n=1 Tax=hydrothermal vent metagenome TaxID=652676 RepID=A0A3B0XLR1_9ZZZZ
MFSEKVTTMCDLVSVALQAEREAIRQYSRLAESMHRANNKSVAALFERMVIEEAAHEASLLNWMSKQGIVFDEASADAGLMSWSLPHVSAAAYSEDACDPYYSTPYKALAFAVHNEEIAFHFYTRVAAYSEDTELQKYAENLAREELAHAALLRAERRFAYHKAQKSDMREVGAVEFRLDPLAIRTEADLLSAAIHIDNYLIGQMLETAEKNSQIKALVSDLQQHVSKNEAALNEKVRHNIIPGKEVTENLERLKSQNIFFKQKLDNADVGFQRLWACCDRSFAFYDAIVETAAGESLMLTAQSLTSSALDRIGVLKQIIDNSPEM